jgi:hypothetical protein
MDLLISLTVRLDVELRQRCTTIVEDGEYLSQIFVENSSFFVHFFVRDQLTKIILSIA